MATTKANKKTTLPAQGYEMFTLGCLIIVFMVIGAIFESTARYPIYLRVLGFVLLLLGVIGWLIFVISLIEGRKNK